ncbi:hypothetical protein [Flavobacterium polysaccharolyticum]|uniref:Lipoprotein n=1 Tax=Flavobacterium polysaccharolyticum TaxID=3133148 RepID=A0ABU9NKA3_9FLAO|nr:hypothetical protein [uncultured Flavobacterium sp.]
MTRQLIIFLTILFTACGQKNATIKNDKVENHSFILTESSQEFSISKTTLEDFTKAKNSYKDKLIQDTLNIRKVNGITEVYLNRPHYPSSVIFKDTLVGLGETEEREYHYLGHFPDLDNYLVSGTFWEHYECYLIDKKTGRKTTTWNRPFLSPTSKYFANLSMTYGLEGVPNGIQIWKVETANQNYLSKYLELDQQIWVPDDFVWETNNSLILKVASVDKYLNENGQPNEKDFYYLRLLLKR